VTVYAPRTSVAALLVLVGCQEYGLSGRQPVETPPVEETQPPPDNVPGEPIADAGNDAEVQPLDAVVLDGTESYDPAGYDIVDVEWTLVSAPAGSTTELSDRHSPRPSLFVDFAGDYVFELTVQNAKGVWDSTPDRVTVTALPLDGFYVELSWDADNDLDLHLLHGDAAIFSNGDCDWCNQHPAWNEAGRPDDPSLDWDMINGFGPETITIDDPSPDEYRVGVHYYGENALAACIGPCAQATATINVYISGELAASYSQSFDDQGQVWEAAVIDWPSGDVTEVDDVGTTPKTTCF
jgi:hypothetical protein